MVDAIRGNPDRVVVTVLADIGRIDMGLTLSGCGRTIVATKAITGYSGVVESCRYPRSCRMAGIAIVMA